MASCHPEGTLATEEFGLAVAGHFEAGFEDQVHRPQPQDNRTKILQLVELASE